MDPRPPVSPAKLLNQFNDWIEETEMPGRTMAYLKTGMLHEVLGEHADDAGVSGMLEAWALWEKGAVGPAPTLEALRDHGLVDFLISLSS